MVSNENQTRGSKRNDQMKNGEEMVSIQSELESSTDLILKNNEVAQINPVTVESNNFLSHMNILGFSPLISSAKDIISCQSSHLKNPSVSSVNMSYFPSATMVN